MIRSISKLFLHNTRIPTERNNQDLHDSDIFIQIELPCFWLSKYAQSIKEEHVIRHLAWAGFETNPPPSTIFTITYREGLRYERWAIIGHIAHRRALALTILGRSCVKLFKLVHNNVHVHNKRYICITPEQMGEYGWTWALLEGNIIQHLDLNLPSWTELMSILNYFMIHSCLILCKVDWKPT